MRPGASKADISAEFALHPTSALQQKLLTDELIDPDADTCLLRRVISAEGRSRAFINAVPVTLNYLKEVGDALVEIQAERTPTTGDRNVQRAPRRLRHQGAQSAKVKALYQAWKTTEQRIHELQERVATQDDRKELLSYQLQGSIPPTYKLAS